MEIVKQTHTFQGLFIEWKNTHGCINLLVTILQQYFIAFEFVSTETRNGEWGDGTKMSIAFWQQKKKSLQITNF